MANIRETNDSDVIRGMREDDLIQGLGGDDRITDIWGDNEINGDVGNDRIDASRGTDIVDGGNGSDIIWTRNGDDVATYRLDENVGATDYYDGGYDSDTLRLVMTQGEFESEAVQDDIEDFQTFLAANNNENTAGQPVFSVYCFRSYGKELRTV